MNATELRALAEKARDTQYRGALQHLRSHHEADAICDGFLALLDERDAMMRDIARMNTTITEMENEAEQAEAERERLRAALIDMHAGWRYIRKHYGDLPGVGWDRCDAAATAALNNGDAA